jgi:hypothetical protein
MHTSTAAFAVLGLTCAAQAHMVMTNPVPFGKSTLNNSPLANPSDNAGTASDFPCKQRPGVYDAEGANTQMALGSTFANVSFMGSAVHGGGSCQFSITYDMEPTEKSIFKVIHSIEGGCPAKNTPGNLGDDANEVDPDTYSFTLPSNIPTGPAVLSWTWFNKVGNREMYQNCAPITLTAASSKRSEKLMQRDSAAYNALPDMFVANINNGGSCATQNGDLEFPDPGASVERFNQSALFPPTGCTSAAVVGGSPAASSQPLQAPSASSSMASASSVSPVASSAPAASSHASTPVASSSAPLASGSSGSNAAGTACTTEGEWNCIGGTSFQQCASGVWSIAQPVAVGTSCTPGQSMDIDLVRSPSAGKLKRALRFFRS